jgi:plasmid stabilization system protein ParE
MIAAVQAPRDGRRADLDVILRHGCREHMLLSAVRLLRELADELAQAGATPEEFRRWCLQAGSRYRS